jgi:hypothetical protein
MSGWFQTIKIHTNDYVVVVLCCIFQCVLFQTMNGTRQGTESRILSVVGSTAASNNKPLDCMRCALLRIFVSVFSAKSCTGIYRYLIVVLGPEVMKKRDPTCCQMPNAHPVPSI